MGAHRAPKQPIIRLGLRRSRRRTAVVTALALSLVATATGIALAYWSSSAGAGAATVTTGTLQPPTSVAATSTPGTHAVDVSWSPPAGALSPVSYAVTRVDAGNVAVDACGTSAGTPTSGTSCQDTSVPIGTYTYVVTALFHSWTAASTPSAPVDVVKATQTIVFTSTPPSDAVVDGPTYTVTATGGGSGNPVVFSIDAVSGNVCSIAGATVSFHHHGTCVIDANEAGDGNYLPADQVQQSVAVGPGAQAINFTSTPPSPAYVNDTYTVSAAGGASGNPVVYSIDASATTVCSISGNTVTFIAAGSCLINADQAGDSDYLAAAQTQQQITVVKRSQTITFTSTPPANATFGGPSYTATATASSGLTVTFSSGTPGVCTSGGTNGATFTFVGVGTCTVSAGQPGSAAYDAAPQVQQSFTVGKANQTITFTSSAPANATVGGATYTATATASSGLAVTFSSATPGVCTSGGTNGATFTFVAAGTCTVNANQAGNGLYNAAPQAQQSFAVSGVVNPTITSVSPATLPHNGAVTTVTVTGTGFQSGITVSVSDPTYVVQSVTFLSSTQIKVAIKNNYANSGTHQANLTVTNPDGGTATRLNAISN